MYISCSNFYISVYFVPIRRHFTIKITALLCLHFLVQSRRSIDSAMYVSMTFAIFLVDSDLWHFRRHTKSRWCSSFKNTWSPLHYCERFVLYHMFVCFILLLLSPYIFCVNCHQSCIKSHCYPNRATATRMQAHKACQKHHASQFGEGKLCLHHEDKLSKTIILTNLSLFSIFLFHISLNQSSKPIENLITVNMFDFLDEKKEN